MVTFDSICVGITHLTKNQTIAVRFDFSTYLRRQGTLNRE
jgi:hypothetical protein